MQLAIKPDHLLRHQLVEVRSLPEIAATLDADGRLDGLPFMPEMVAFCGRQFRVYRRAEKTCVEGYGMRRMHATVLLQGVHCDGAAHDGCQRHCMIFWKEAWLKPVVADTSLHDQHPAHPAPVRELPTRNGERYICQSTELHTASTTLSSLNLAQYLRELRVHELTLGRFWQIARRIVSNRARRLLGRPEIGALRGEGTRHSKGALELRRGDRVEVRSPAEIRATLDRNGRNRGLSFEPDMIEYCGGQFEVDFVIERIVSEQTGRMVALTNTVALKGVTCEGLCAKNCPRNNPHYWREAWLRRVS